MSGIYCSTVINAPLEKLWVHLRDFGALGTYQSSVAEIRLEGAPGGGEVGSIRHIRLHEGKFEGRRLRERLVALSDIDHSGTYAVETEGAPFANCLGRFQLRPITDSGATFIEWSTTFDVIVEGAGPALCEFLIHEIYADCFRGLKVLAERPSG